MHTKTSLYINLVLVSLVLSIHLHIVLKCCYPLLLFLSCPRNLSLCFPQCNTVRLTPPFTLCDTPLSPHRPCYPCSPLPPYSFTWLPYNVICHISYFLHVCMTDSCSPSRGLEAMCIMDVIHLSSLKSVTFSL